MTLGSAVLGGPDDLYRHIPKPRDLRFFTGGFGDIEKLHASINHFRDWLHNGGCETGGSDVALDRTGCCGTFRSPMANFLPVESAEVSFRMVLPPSSLGPPHAFVVLLPGTGDQGFAYRQFMLAQPLLSAGIACVMATVPLYGTRRPPTQRLHFVPTVEQFMIQSAAVQMESLALLSWLRREHPSALLGVSGISWGGAMSAAVGLLWDGPIAIAPLCGPASSDLLRAGALRGDVAWDALAEDLGVDSAAAEERLQCLFDEYSIRSMVAEIKSNAAEGAAASRRSAEAHKVAILAMAAHDSFVPREQVKALHEHMHGLIPGAELVSIAGGHTSAHAFARWQLAKFVRQSVERLAADLGRSRLEHEGLAEGLVRGTALLRSRL
jgi:dienelactone hydrolase